MNDQQKATFVHSKREERVVSNTTMEPSRRERRRAEQQSRRTVKMLRHDLWKHDPNGHLMDTEGFVDIEELARVLEITVDQVVEFADLSRVEVKDSKIRAMQGHSDKLRHHYHLHLCEKNIESLEENEVFVHFTSERNIESIQKNGLGYNTGRGTHFANIFNENRVKHASHLAKRRCEDPGEIIGLQIDLRRWLEDGHRCEHGSKDVIVIPDIIPFTYLSIHQREQE